MRPGGRGVDFVNIDGGEGGTGAAPLVFTDSVAYPFRIGFAQVYGRFAQAGLTDDVVFLGGGKLGLPENAVVAFALGVDGVQVAREAMFALGCIQAQRCHTDHCPTGVTTQKPRLVRGLDPDSKSRAGAQLRGRPAPRPAQGLRGGGRLPPRPDRPGRRGRGRRAAQHRGGARASTATSRAGASSGRPCARRSSAIMAGNLPTSETPPTR